MADNILADYQNLIVRMKKSKVEYIRKHYRKIPRSELAKRLGIPKYDLNMLLIKMGIGH